MKLRGNGYSKCLVVLGVLISAIFIGLVGLELWKLLILR